METEYRSIEYRLHESLVQMQEMLSILEFDHSLLDCIQDCKELIKNKQYKVAVMGEFKRGKSSLINALLGAKILPADATPTTATINRITYGPEPGAVIAFRDGTSREISVGELEDYVTKRTADGEARALQIKEATIYFPTVICQNHIDIIDTPGLNDDPRMTRITIEMIEHVDAVIVPIHARAPFSETEKKFVCQLMESENIQNLVFVVTFLDQLDEDDYEYETFMEYIRRRIQSEVFAELERRGSPESVTKKAHRLLDQLQVNGISSAQALESFVTNNRDLRRKSRFEPFCDVLLGVVTAKQLENAVRKTVAALETVVGRFDEQNQKRRKALEEGFRTLEACREMVAQYCQDASRVLETALSRESDTLQAMINSFNANKNYIVEESIKGLSQVRENRHEVILAVLEETSQRVREEMHRRCLERETALIEFFRTALSQLQEQERRELQAVSCLLGMGDQIGFEQTAEAMERFTEVIFHNAVFSWEVSSLFRGQDLARCNVIETVIRAADVSVASYIGELREIVATVRRNWSDQFCAHTRALAAWAAEELDGKRENQDLQYKAYLRNYQTVYQSAQDILKTSQALWEAFERGERL